MSVFLLIVVLLSLGVAGYFLGRSRALGSVGGNIRQLHSLPAYYGWHGAIMAMLPAFAVLVLWVIAQPLLIERQLADFFPAEQFENDSQRILLMADVRRVAEGLDTAVAAGALTDEQAAMIRTEFGSVRDRLGEVGVALGSEVTPQVLQAAQQYRELASTGGLWRSILVLIVAGASFVYALKVTNGDFRARNRVEAVVLGLLIDNPVFVAEMTQLVQGYMVEATPMSLAKWRARPWYKKAMENMFYLFSPLL